MDANGIDRIVRLVAASRLSRRRAILGGALAVTASRAARSRASAADAPLQSAITSVMRKSRYARSTWSLLVTDLASGETIYGLNPDRLALTGSVRKLFSVGLALRQLGADHRFTTPVHRAGAVDGQGALDGDLILVAAGDLTLGGRAAADDSIAFTDFDHNDANNLGTAILTTQDPLHGLDALAQGVRAAGIQRVSGDVVIDDRLFDPFRVPNQNLLITPIMVNENMVDVTITPTTAGEAATVVWRPHSGAFAVDAHVTTTAAGTPDTVTLSGGGRVECIGAAGCAGTVEGDIPADFRAPLSGQPELVQTFRIEDPAAFARTAFIEALQRAGVTVAAAPVAPNPAAKLPAPDSYAADARVAQFVSPPYAAYARLILKVSLNLGANLSLMLFALAHG
ncbi:MAG TPA: D-alanyl-D-alanine carboxypeptidase, partial [Thermomicrobiales bacterium]|nr:D-alanyl-D-alanine carboxypeptidase [Thermomicrobiales bacterium]